MQVTFFYGLALTNPNYSETSKLVYIPPLFSGILFAIFSTTFFQIGYNSPKRLVVSNPKHFATDISRSEMTPLPPFGNFAKIHPYLKRQASLRATMEFL